MYVQCSKIHVKRGHGYEARGYEAEAKPKLWLEHESEAEALTFLNHEPEAEALPFLDHDAEAKAYVIDVYYKGHCFTL